jgi:hypothetical protein
MNPSLNRLLTTSVFAALILMFFQPTAAANPCGDLPKTALGVDMHDAEPEIDTTKTLEELDSLMASQLSQDNARPHRLMVATADLTYRAHTDGRVIEVDGVFCAAPASVAIQIDFYRRTVHVAREALPDQGCVNALVLHAAKHAEAEEAALQNFILSIKESLTSRLAVLKQTPASTRAQAAQWFSAGLKSATEESVLRFAKQRGGLRKDVDTPADIAQLDAACGGVLKKLGHGAELPLRGSGKKVSRSTSSM